MYETGGYSKLSIVNDEADFICKKCPLKKKNKCSINETEHIRKYLGEAFLDNYYSKDSILARIYGLNIGQEYTVKELRERAGF